MILLRTWRLAILNASRRARGLQSLLILAVSIAAGLFLVQNFELGSALETAAKVPSLVLLAAAAFLGFGLILSSVRYQRVLDALGLHIPFRLAFQANMFGVIGGLLFFQLLGQTLARTAVLSRHGVGGSAVLIANVYERATAIASLIVLTIAAVLYLHGSITIDLFGGTAGLIKFVGAIIIVALAAYWFAARRLVRLSLKRALRIETLRGLAKISLYSVFMHLSTLAAFIVLARVMVPDVPLLDLSAASLIVMFAASVPISFAGWGVRELSAVYAFGMLGIDPQTALAISILIGVMSLMLVIILGWQSWVSSHGHTTPAASARAYGSKIRSLQIERTLAWFIPLVTAGLVFFQVHVPFSSGKLNFNLADPVAIGGGLVFLSRFLSMDDRTVAWRTKGFEALLIAATIAITLALLNGWLRYGYSNWAFYNRFIGWFILLSYFATGALIAGALHRAGLKLLLKCLLAAGMAIALLDLALLAGNAVGMPWNAYLPDNLLRGLTQNANAFSLEMTVLIAIVCALNGRVRAQRSTDWDYMGVFTLSILLLANCYSLSRTGLITSMAVVAVALAFRWVSARLILLAVTITVAVFFSPVLLKLSTAAFHYVGLSTPELASGLTTASPLRIVHDSSDSERWYSISRGLELWLQNPIFGNGLGAFVASVKAEQGTMLVIHNSGVWMLAEMGVLGFAIFAVAFFVVVRAALSRASREEPWARVLVLVLLTFALFQMTHDVFYQRLFWLVIGATLFVGPWKRQHQVPHLDADPASLPSNVAHLPLRSSNVRAPALPVSAHVAGRQSAHLKQPRD